jgi:hypothetical protein
MIGFDQLHPFNCLMAHCSAMAYYIQGEWKAARNDLDKAIDLNRDYAAVYYFRVAIVLTNV